MKKVLLAIAAVCLAATMNAQTIMTEGFDNGIPSTWTMFTDANTAHNPNFANAWNATSNYGGNPAPCVASVSWFDPTGTADRWLITDAITIPAETGYIFAIEAKCYEEAYPDGFQVRVCTTTPTSRTDFDATPIINVAQCTGTFTEYSGSLDAYAGQTIYIAVIQNSHDMNFLLADNFTVKKLSENEIVMNGITIPSFAAINTDLHISGTITNKGSQNLTCFDLAYTVNGGTPVSKHISGLDVAYNGTYTFTTTTPINMPVAGVANIAVTISNPNDSADVTTDNTANGTITFYDPLTAVDRTVLMEHFTTAQCPNCPSAHERLGQAIAGRNDIIWLAHHAGYYTDNLTIQASEDMCAFYNDGGSTYAPAIMLDRTKLTTDPGPVFFPGEVATIQATFNQAAEIPSFVNVTVDNVTFDEASRTLTATVSGSITSDIAFDSPRLSLYLVEDSIVMTQSGATGTYLHNHAIRACISDEWGDTDPFTTTTAGSTFTKTYTYTMPATMKAWRCRLIGFVSNYAENVNNRKICNAYQTANIEATYVGINEVGTDVVLNIFPNPAADFVMINADQNINEVKIVNTLGQTIYTNNNVNAESIRLNTQNYAAGMYIVTVKTNKGISTQRFSVVK